MILTKRINNNFALGADSNGEQIIIEGKGIGFQKMPCTITDYSMVTRTYYDFDQQYIDLISSIPQELLNVANEVFEYLTSSVTCPVNQNLPFILADHIGFAIKRLTKNIKVRIPIYYDLKYLYPLEYEVAQYALKRVKVEIGVTLPEDEISGIMFNIINAESDAAEVKRNSKFQGWIEEITETVEKSMNVRISRDSFNYSRFVSHMNYLFKRLSQNKMASSENVQMYRTLAKQYPSVSECVDRIALKLKVRNGAELNDEEKLYLILHINRLCDREDGDRTT